MLPCTSSYVDQANFVALERPVFFFLSNSKSSTKVVKYSEILLFALGMANRVVPLFLALRPQVELTTLHYLITQSL